MYHRTQSLSVVRAVLALVVLGSAACSSTDSSSVTRELLTMSKEEAYARGEALVSKRKYEAGRQYLRFVAENYANDALGKQAALRLADSFFEEKSALGYVEAQGRYKDFRSRYPSHPRSDYALFRLAQVSDRQAEKPDRDQANTRLATQSYRELLQNFPGSPYTAEARARYKAMLDLLAEHEFLVAQYYYKRSAWEASRTRFEGLFASFPEYARMDKALFWAGLTEKRLGRDEDARALFERLRRDYPKSTYLRKLPKVASPAAALTATAGL
ncbi:MAG: outer membrane protein assembly factor BamD [Deltaproteobacteria bacterium]|nr:outer membrane protein assembly factor BamD [Deltaproteobacteria bacterium]